MATNFYLSRGKHSSGDLQSRLKTRKLLGVGETDDGDVHRSKLSQILGHSEQLYIRLPRGLRCCQLLSGVWCTFIALWALLFPVHHFTVTYETDDVQHVTVPVRLYGGALFSLALILWSTYHSAERHVIKWSLLASAVYFSIHTFVSFCTLVTNGGFSRYSCLLIFLRMVLVAANVYYYLAIDSKLYHLQRSLGLLKHDERGSPAGSPNGDTAERPVTEKKDK